MGEAKRRALYRTTLTAREAAERAEAVAEFDRAYAKRLAASVKRKAKREDDKAAAAKRSEAAKRAAATRKARAQLALDAQGWNPRLGA